MPSKAARPPSKTKAQISATSHLTWGQSDLRVPKLNIHRSSKVEEILEEYHGMQTSGTFTDLDLVTGDRKKISVHSLVLAASSEFIKHWMEGTFVADLHYNFLLPDFHSDEVSLLVGILYGADVTLEQRHADKLNELAEHLGITVDLPFRTVGHHGAPVVPEEPKILPLCCWHCNSTFPNLDELKEHIGSHQGERFKKKYHKCPTCSKVLPSMWKFRQHLLKHAVPKTKNFKKADHLYAEAPPKRLVPTSTAESIDDSQRAERSSKDHQYASAEADPTNYEQHHAMATQHSQDHSYGSLVQQPVSQSEQHVESQAIAHLYPDGVVLADPTSQELTPQRQSSRVAARKAPDPPQLLAEGTVQSDHLYSSVPPTEIPVFTAAQSTEPSPVSSPLKGAQKRKAPIKKKVEVKAKRQSIQALGHSYAAARPRRISGVMPPVEAQMYPCDQCDKVFPVPYRLNRHIKEVHVREKFHFCRFCDKSFFKLTSKNRHELTHTSHELWKCSVCDRTFRDQSSLTYHQKHKVCTRPKKTK